MAKAFACFMAAGNIIVGAQAVVALWPTTPFLAISAGGAFLCAVALSLEMGWS